MAWDNYSAIDQITKCHFECEGGPLANNVAWRWLKERIDDGPRYAMGQVVEMDVGGTINGVHISQVCLFTVVGIRMQSDARRRTYVYDLSDDPPYPWHYGRTNFPSVDEQKLRCPTPTPNSTTLLSAVSAKEANRSE